MNKIRHMRDVVIYEGQSYYVSTNDIPGVGYETMIFQCYKRIKTTLELDDKRVNWSEIYVERYKSAKEAVNKHYEIVKNIEKYIER